MISHLRVALAVRKAFWADRLVGVRFQMIQHMTAMLVSIKLQLDKTLYAGDAVASATIEADEIVT